MLRETLGWIHLAEYVNYFRAVIDNNKVEIPCMKRVFFQAEGL
jgi:hypothetical protein